MLDEGGGVGGDAVLGGLVDGGPVGLDEGDDLLLTDDIAEDALNAMRFLPGEVTSAIETSLARVYDVDADELAELLFPED